MSNRLTPSWVSVPNRPGQVRELHGVYGFIDLLICPIDTVADGLTSFSTESVQANDEEETYKRNHEKKLRYVNSRKGLRDKTVEWKR